MDTVDSLEDEYTVVVFPPALLDEDIGTAASVITVRLDPGVTRTAAAPAPGRATGRSSAGWPTTTCR